jgi:hypothetical protein
MGVITYFLLCGYTPFDRDTQQQEMEAIIRGDYRFEPGLISSALLVVDANSAIQPSTGQMCPRRPRTLFATV